MQPPDWLDVLAAHREREGRVNLECAIGDHSLSPRPPSGGPVFLSMGVEMGTGRRKVWVTDDGFGWRFDPTVSRLRPRLGIHPTRTPDPVVEALTV